MKNDIETHETTDFQFEFYAKNYETYEKSSQFGSYIDNKNYIQLVVILNSLVDIEKDIKKHRTVNLQHELVEETVILIRQIGEALEAIFAKGVIPTDLRFNRILNTYVHSTSFLKPYNKLGINWVLKQIPFSLQLSYTSTIVIFAEYLKTSNWFSSIDEKVINNIKSIHFQKQDTIFRTMTYEIQKNAKDASS